MHKMSNEMVVEITDSGLH